MGKQKTRPISRVSLAAAEAEAVRIRHQLARLPHPAAPFTAEELKDAAPFYFVLRGYIRQLKEARESAGLTLADVSARTGIAVESLSRLETGAQTNPTWRTLGLYTVAVNRQPLLQVSLPKGRKGPIHWGLLAPSGARFFWDTSGGRVAGRTDGATSNSLDRELNLSLELS